MRAASRETYALANEKLSEITRTSDAAALANTGDELLGVASVLAREPRLRRALSDPARQPSDRAALLDGIVANAVGADTRTLVGILASGRWSSAGELLDGTEALGVEALLASAEAAGDLGEVEDELFRFGQVVNGSPELASALGDINTEPSARATIVEGLLGGKAKPVTVRLVKLALTSFGGRTFDGALTRLVELAADRRNRQVAYVTVATALSDADEARIGARLAQMYGREMSLQVNVDPAVLGGVRVLVGSDLYDGTTLRRLTDTRHAMSGK